MSETDRLKLPKIDSNMTADVPRDLNALAEAIDEKVASREDLNNIKVPVKSVNNKTGDVNLTADDVGAATPQDVQKAEQNAKEYADQQVGNINVPVTSVNSKTGDVNLTAEDVGAETPQGAQEKANTAEASAKNYADQQVSNLAGAGNTKTVKQLADEQTAHSADEILHGTVRYNNVRYEVVIGDEFGLQKVSNEQENDITAIAEDDDFIYVFIKTSRTITKIHKSTLTTFKISSFTSNGDVRTLLNDDITNSLYYVYSTYLYKVTKSSLSRTSSPSLGGTGNGYLTQDELYIYLCMNDGTVQKRSKSDLSLIATSEALNRPSDILVDEGFVYLRTGPSDTLLKLNKASLTIVAQYSTNIGLISQDAEYIYIGGNNGLTKLLKSNLSEVAFNGQTLTAYFLENDEKYVYSVSGSELCIIDKSILSIEKIVIEGVTGTLISLDENFIYLPKNQKIYALSKNNEILGARRIG